MIFTAINIVQTSFFERYTGTEKAYELATFSSANVELITRTKGLDQIHRIVL